MVFKKGRWNKHKKFNAYPSTHQLLSNKGKIGDTVKEAKEFLPKIIEEGEEDSNKKPINSLAIKYESFR